MTEHADHTRGVRERRDRGEELRFDILTGDEPVDGLDPGGTRGLEEILPLADEQPELRALASAFEPADQLQPRVARGGDQPSAAFACSAIAANAAGSLTARSASTLRSSSISAFLQPATNWL